MSRGVAGRLRLSPLIASRARQAVVSRLYGSPLLRWRLASGEPERLVLAPQELRLVDKDVGTAIAEGRFAFAGTALELHAVSPFRVAPPSPGWQRALLTFSWLRHLGGVEGGAARARILVGEFVRSPLRYSPQALEPLTTGRRLLAMLSQSPLVLEDADRGFYRAFLRSLHWQSRFLLRAGKSGQDGMPRLVAAIAATQASLCLADPACLRPAMRLLAKELGRQILPDGGHISRNPEAVLELLHDLLPLRQSFATRDIAPPPELMTSVDRLMPMLRLFCRADGTLAAFNGMGHVRKETVSGLFALDETRGKPIRNAPHSGYQRLDGGGSVVIVDTGRLPPIAVSIQAHAGALSFEFSAGAASIIVNCGAPGPDRDRWRQVARATPAHSTAAIADRSSVVFATDAGAFLSLGRPILAGPSATPVERNEGAERATLILSHDGYRRAFGVVHRRRLELDLVTGALFGEDAFLTPSGAPWTGAEPIAIRFHLHPGVAPSLLTGQSEIRLDIEGAPPWRFRATGHILSVEESLYFAGPRGPEATRQIVIELGPADGASRGASWLLEPII